MLAPNWEDHDAETCEIINYFADRPHAEKIVKDQEYFVAKSCNYGKICQKCRKLNEYRQVFKKKGFWTFNKDVKYWDVYDPDWSYRNRTFSLEPLRRYRM